MKTKILNTDCNFINQFAVANPHLKLPDSCLYLLFQHKCLPLSKITKNCWQSVWQFGYRDIFGQGIVEILFTGKMINNKRSNETE